MLRYILQGGVIMIPLLSLSVIALSVILDRIRAFRSAEIDAFKLREAVGTHLENGHLDDAMQECQRFGGPVAAVLLVGLDKYRRLLARGRSRTEIETITTKSMEDYAPRAMDSLEKRLNLLTLVAGISPLLGMTGTVTGMIRSFNTMAASGVDAAGVASGISEALITTAAGLLIAIPAVVAYNLFTKRIDRCALEIEETMMELLDYITLGADEG